MPKTNPPVATLELRTNRVREFMAAEGIATTAVLATRTGISEDTAKRMMAGRFKPSTNFLAGLAHLGLPLDEAVNVVPVDDAS